MPTKITIYPTYSIKCPECHVCPVDHYTTEACCGSDSSDDTRIHYKRVEHYICNNCKHRWNNLK